MDIFEWWNLIFLLPGAGALLLLFFQMAGLAGDHDTDADVSPDAHGFDHDFDHSLESGFDAAHAHEMHGAEGHPETSILAEALGFLGIGKVPIGIVLMTLAFVWAFVGWASNKTLKEIVPSPLIFVWFSMLAAGTCAIMATRVIARMFSRFMPGTASFAEHERELVGRRGEARYAITEHSGAVAVRDHYGNTIELLCRAKKGEEIPAGMLVVLMRYDEARRVYEVAIDPLRGLEKPRTHSKIS